MEISSATPERALEKFAASQPSRTGLVYLTIRKYDGNRFLERESEDELGPRSSNRGGGKNELGGRFEG